MPITREGKRAAVALGEALRARREARDLTQTDVAAMVARALHRRPYHHTRVSRWESGELPPRFEQLRVLGSVLELDVSQFL